MEPLVIILPSLVVLVAGAIIGLAFRGLLPMPKMSDVSGIKPTKQTAVIASTVIVALIIGTIFATTENISQPTNPWYWFTGISAIVTVIGCFMEDKVKIRWLLRAAFPVSIAIWLFAIMMPEGDGPIKWDAPVNRITGANLPPNGSKSRPWPAGPGDGARVPIEVSGGETFYVQEPDWERAFYWCPTLSLVYMGPVVGSDPPLAKFKSSGPGGGAGIGWAYKLSDCP